MRHDQTQNEREVWPVYDMQGVWEHPHTHTQWTQVQQMPCMGVQRGTRKGCRGFTLLPHVMGCFAKVPKLKLLVGARQQHSRRNTPDGGRADGGRAVRSTPPERTRGLPSFAPGGVYRLSCHGSCAHGGRERTRCRSIWSQRVQARRSHRAVRKPRTPQQYSLGLRRSCWSWRGPCWRCVLSGTSRRVCGEGCESIDPLDDTCDAR